MKIGKQHNVIRERVETYKDFTISLLYIIYETYLGKNYIKTPKDKEGHFNWCFGKVLSNFFDEEIDLYKNNELYEYFGTYYNNQFYEIDKIKPISYYEKFWTNIFDYKKPNRNKKLSDIMFILYNIFDESILIKNKKSKII